MKRTIIITSALLVVIVLATAGYWHFGVSFYAKNNATFGEVKEKQYNKETFMAVIYDQQSELSQKAEPLFQELAKEKGLPLLAIDKNGISADAHGLPFNDETVVPAFYYFEDGQLRMIVEGYHPLEVYLQGFEEVRRMEDKQKEKEGGQQHAD